MRSLRCRRRAARVSRFECIEPRLVMSGNAAGEIFQQFFVEDQCFTEAQSALLDAHVLSGLDEARSQYGLTGQGQTVVVIDSGVAYTHTALGGGLGAEYRVVGGYDFTEERDADPYDDGPFGAHGTHVAGIIAGDNDAVPGVAPGVDLVALRVFNDDGVGQFDWIEEALGWVHVNRDAFENPITTVNLSIGTSWNSDNTPYWSTIEDELAQLEADGIFISVAAGNSFTTYETPGLSYPAASPYVVPVASVDADGQMSYFSQRNDRVIAAPGRSITSTVPDYVGNGNGVDDDYARFSGTSMAAPYVAGASVLLRQAYEFAGALDVTQDMIYDLMRDTADMVYDAATGASYHRLNLQRALDSVMPEDDFGSSAAAAHNLGSVTDTLSLGGTIGSLEDQDFFTFTATAGGQLTLSAEVTDYLDVEWHTGADGYNAQAVDGSLVLDVTAGQTYTIGLGTAAGIGHYTLDVMLDAPESTPDLGGIGQAEFLDNQVSAAGYVLAFAASRDGILTVEAVFDDSQGDVDLQLYDAQQRLIAGSYSSADYERVDVAAAAGETFYLYAYNNGSGENGDVDFRITNLVSQDGQAVNVLGTDGDDAFTFTAGTTHRVSINGVLYSFDAREVNAVTFDGLAGSDTITLEGTAGDDTAVLRVGSSELTGSGYTAGAVNVEAVTVRGRGGSDTASLYDSAGDDTLTATPNDALLTGTGFSSQVIDFDTVHAYAKSGGFDTATLYDSAGNDTFLAKPTYSRLTGDGFYRRAKFFESVTACATAGGYDMALLYDSAGDDTFTADPTYGELSGDGFSYRAEAFDAVHAYAKYGGYDRATLYDSAGDDSFVRTALYGRLTGSGFYNRAKFFEEVNVEATAGGNDHARLYDSALDDHFEASGSTAGLASAKAVTWIDGFDQVRLYGFGGGTNRTEISAVDYILKILGEWQ